MSKTIPWYDCHNFNGDTCGKCGLVEKYPKGGWEKIKQTQCPIRSLTDAKSAYRQHSWIMLPPDTMTYIGYKPFHVMELKFEDLL